MSIHRRRPLPTVFAAAVPAILAGSLVAPAAAQMPAPPPAAAPASAEDLAPLEIMGMPVPGPRRSDDVLPAQQALERMVMAYRNAPFLVDDIRMQELYMNAPQPEARGRVILGSGTDCVIEAPRSRAVTKGDRFFYETERVRSRYIDVPLEQNIVHMMREVVKLRPGLGWHAKARYGDPADSVLFSLSFGVPDPTTIAGYERTTLPDDREVHRVTLMADSGWSVVTIDAETDLLLALDVDFQPPGTPIETFRITRHIRCSPRVLDELPESISFDPRDRDPVETRAALLGRTVAGAPVQLGVEPGAALELPSLVTIEGLPWSPEDRRGRVQVIVGWSLGSVAFRRGVIPIRALRDDLASRNGDVPVDFWLMNTLENEDDLDADETKWDAVYEFWHAADFGVDCLFDDQDEFADAIGLADVPATIVIDAYGRLVGTQGGLDGSWPTIVRELIDTAAAATPPADKESPAGG